MRLIGQFIFCLTLALLAGACAPPEERAAEHLEKAEALYAAEDYVKAKLEAMNATQIEPKNVAARFMLAQIAEKEERYRDAVGHLLVAVDADPAHLGARIKLGTYYFAGGATDEAAEQVAAALELAPDNPEVLLLQARVRHLRGDREGAVEAVEAAMAADPELDNARIFRAGLYADDGEGEAAIRLLDERIAQLPAEDSQLLRQFRIMLLQRANRTEDVESELRLLAEEFPEEIGYQQSLARFYMSQGRVDEAENLLRGIVEADPEDEDRRVGFAQFLRAERSDKAAEEALLAFIDESPESTRLRLSLGLLYESGDRLDEAMSVYREIVDMNPTGDDGLAARNRMAAIHVVRGEEEEARRIIDGILADQQDNADALFYRAAFSFVEQRNDDAIADLRIVLRKFPESQRALLLLARAHVRAGDAVLAQDAYRRLVELNPGHPQAATELAALLANQGDTSTAREVLRQNIDADPANKTARSGLVQLLLAEGDLQSAEETARSLTGDEDKTGLGDFQVGRVLQAKGSTDEAIQAYREALEKSPGAPQPMRGLVSALVEAGRSDEAIAYLRSVLAEGPEQVFPRYLLAASLQRSGDLQGAEAVYSEIIELQPADLRAYVSLAGLYPNDADRRMAIYERAQRANPANSPVALLLATEYESAGRYEDAIGVYEKILETDADNVIAANNLAALLLDHRNDAASHERALRLARQFSNSRQPMLVDTLGWAYYRNGDIETATRYLEIAVAGADQVPVLNYHLGMAYLAAGNSVGARQQLQKAITQGDADYTGIDEAREAYAGLQGDAVLN